MRASDSGDRKTAKAQKNPAQPHAQSSGLRCSWFEIVGSTYAIRKRGGSGGNFIRALGHAPTGDASVGSEN